MKSKAISKFARLTAVSGIAAVSVGALSTSAYAADDAAGNQSATNVPYSQGDVAPGYNDIFGPDTTYAGAFTVQTEDGKVVRAFCVEVGVPYDQNDTAMELEASPVTQLRSGGDPALLPQAMWIANNSTLYSSTDYTPVSSTVGTPLNTAEYNQFVQAAENAAAQLAIWVVVADRDISDAADPGILARAEELVDLVDGEDNVLGTADDQVAPIAAASYTLETSFADISDGTGDIIVKVLADGQPAEAGVEVVIASTLDVDPTTDGVQTEVVAVTDADGMVRVDGVVRGSQVADVAVSANIEISDGTLMTPAPAADGSDRQQILTTGGGQIARSAALVVPAQVIPPVTTTVPVTTVPVTTVPVTTVPETTVPVTTVPVTTVPVTTVPVTTDLPRTGPEVGLIALVAAAALGAGGIVLVSRRRES